MSARVCRAVLEVRAALQGLCAAHSVFQTAAAWATAALHLKKPRDLQLSSGIGGLCCCGGVTPASPVSGGAAFPTQLAGLGLATSPVLMFSFTSTSGLFLPFKAWHLRGPSGYSPGNVGIARTFCTISFKQKQTQKHFNGFGRTALNSSLFSH